MPTLSSCEHCDAVYDLTLLRRVERVDTIRTPRTDGGWSRAKTPMDAKAQARPLDGRILQVSPRYRLKLRTPLVCAACYHSLSQIEAAQDQGHKRILMAILLVVAALGLAGLLVPGAMPAIAALASGKKERAIIVDYPPYKPPFAHTPSPPDPH